MTGPTDRYGEIDLIQAGTTEEIYPMAKRLAAWGLRNGECDEYTALDWVLGHPHDDKLPRGSSGKLNPTLRHISKGVQAAIDSFDPAIKSYCFDADKVHALAARIDGSGVRHERYMMGVMALCLKMDTLTPVITGVNLGEIVGVEQGTANRVLREWSRDLAGGLFTGVTFSGIVGHGRIWSVNPDWQPQAAPKRVKHEKGCNRSKARCRCDTKVSQSIPSILTAVKIVGVKCDSDRLNDWLDSLPPGAAVTALDVCHALGYTKRTAVKLLKAAEGGKHLQFGTCKPMRVRSKVNGRWAWTNRGEAWFTPVKQKG